MADENKKYTNRLRDRSTNEVYFVYDEEALHADSSISLLANDANYVKRSELDSLVADNSAFINHDQLTEVLTNYPTTETIDSIYAKKSDLNSITVSGERFLDYSDELNSFDLNDIQELTNVELNTVYKLNNVLNAPNGTGSNGYFHVKKIDNDVLKEEWETTIGQAHRYQTITNTLVNRFGEPTIISYNNDPLAYFVEQDNCYYLNAGGKYILSGLFNKKIIIKKLTIVDNVLDSINDLTNEADNILSTVLVLDGAFIESNSETAIDYTSNYGQLGILVIGSTNAIVVNSNNIIEELSSLNEHSLRSTAIIQSKNNIFISGFGKLSLTSNVSNHAIKGDNVSIKDAVHLYIDLQNGHDGINIGNNENHSVLISDGYLTFKNCRNAIDGGNGYVNILGGTFVFENNTVDIKCSSDNHGRVFNILGKTHIDIEHSDYVEYIDSGNIQEKYGQGYVKSNGVILEPDENGVYVITQPSITVHGYLQNKQLFLAGVPVADNSDEKPSIDVFLDNAYITNDSVKTTYNKGQTIYYSPEDGKVAIHCVDNSVNFVTQTQTEDTNNGCGAIKSENNITIQGDGSLYISSILSDGIDGSDIVIKGDGFRYFKSQNTEPYIKNGQTRYKAAIQGKHISIGEEIDVDTVDPNSNEIKKGKNSYQTIITSGRSIVARKNKSNNKGTIDILKYQVGLILYSISDYAPMVEAENGLINDTAEGYEHKYDVLSCVTDETILNYLSGDVTDRFKANEELRQVNTTNWKVFISSDEVNNRINELSERLLEIINSLNTRILALESGNIQPNNNPFDTLDENGNIIQTEIYDDNDTLVDIDVVEES